MQQNREEAEGYMDDFAWYVIVSALVMLLAVALVYFLGTHLPEETAGGFRVAKIKLNGQVHRAYYKRCYGGYRALIDHTIDIISGVVGEDAAIIYAAVAAKTAKEALRKLVQAIETAMKTGEGVNTDDVEVDVVKSSDRQRKSTILGGKDV